MLQGKSTGSEMRNDDGLVTVLFPGGDFWKRIVPVTVVHVSCWVVAIITGLAAFLRIDDVSENEDAKTLAMVSFYADAGVVVAVLLHAGAVPMPNLPTLGNSAPQEQWSVSGALLLASVAFSFVTSFAMVSTTALLGDAQSYNLAMAAAVFGCLGSMMVLAFYVNFTAQLKGKNEGRGTVLAPGDERGMKVSVGIVHVVCWAGAIAMGVVAYARILDIDKNDKAETLSVASFCADIVAVLAVAVHVCASRGKGDSGSRPVWGAFLLGFVALSLATSSAVLATTTVLDDKQAFVAAIVSAGLNCLGSMMVFSFYINGNAHSSNESDKHGLVVAPGHKEGLRYTVMAVHVLFWVGAIATGWIAYARIYDVVEAADAASGEASSGSGEAANHDHILALSVVSPIVYLLGAAAIFLHSGMSYNLLTDPIAPLSAVAGAFVLASTALAPMLSFAVVATTVVLGDDDAFEIAVAAACCLCFASMMAFSFYLDFTMLGNYQPA